MESSPLSPDELDAVTAKLQVPVRECVCVVSHRQSVTAVLETPEGRLFLKRFGSDGPAIPPDERARREFRVLRHLSGRETGFAIPEPVLQLDDPPVIVMGFVAGVPLDDGLSRILRHPWRFLAARRIEGLFRVLGARIATLGAVPPPPCEPRSLGFAQDAALEAIRDCRDRKILTAETSARLGGVVEEAAATAGRCDSSVCAHGDLGLWNVLSDRSALGLVDFETSCPGPRFSDLAQVTANLSWFLVASGARPGRVRALQRAILEGFGGIPEELRAEWRCVRTVELATRIGRERLHETRAGDIAERLALALLGGSVEETVATIGGVS